MTKLNAKFVRPLVLVCMTVILVAVTATPSLAQTLTTLHSFRGGADGDAPEGTLIQATDGNLYGTTVGGGGTGEGNGSVFKMSPNGALITLYRFCSKSGCPDGSFVDGGLVEGADGNFYGTTSFGGAYDGGTVFKITPRGILTTLYSFCTQPACADGMVPDYPTLLLSDGYLYGTTQRGGISGGTVFRINSRGVLTTLHNFCSESNCTDGHTPSAGLIQGTNGMFYGTTDLGGANQQGTLFEISKAGKFRTVYAFCSQPACADGSEPIAAPVLASDGNLYGTTSGLGGQSTENGTVFRLTPSGTLTTLHVFDHADGSWPAAMIQATDGNLYGTTWNGGLLDGGTLFKITLDGTLTTLYNFCSQSSCSDGQRPIAGLVQETNGEFYGTTSNGGTGASFGTVFSLSVGLGRFVKIQPSYGKVNTKVIILGNNLTGATSVIFNGTPATFTVVSDSYIKAVVPTGATTGLVEVSTPRGTVSSNVTFQILP